MHGRGRRQPDGLADVAHRRRIAVLGRVLLDEVEDLLLALRQVLADVHPIGLLGQLLTGCTNMCSVQYRSSRTDSRPRGPTRRREMFATRPSALPRRPPTVRAHGHRSRPRTRAAQLPRRAVVRRRPGAPARALHRGARRERGRATRSRSTSARPRSASARERATTPPPARSRSSSPPSRSTTPRCSCARSRAGSSSSTWPRTTSASAACAAASARAPARRGPARCAPRSMHLAERGTTAAELREMLAGAELRLVMTAHPTEARRRTTVEKLARIFARLRDLDEHLPVPGDEAAAHRALAGTIQELWGSDEVRAASPTPLDEVHAGLVYFASTLHRVVPELYRELEAAVEEAYPGEEIAVPPLLTFGSWMGGDRDGNPNVTAAVTAEALEMMRTRLPAPARGAGSSCSPSASRCRTGSSTARPRSRRRSSSSPPASPRRPRASSAATPRSPTGGTSPCLVARVRATREDARRRLRVTRRAARRPAHRRARAAGGPGAVRRRHPAARHDPPGRGVRLPLRPARHPRARRPPRRGDRRDPLRARRPRGLRVARARGAQRAARARDRAAAAADPVGSERVLAPRRRRSSGRSARSASCCAGATPARSSPTSSPAPRSPPTCSRCCC